MAKNGGLQPEEAIEHVLALARENKEPEVDVLLSRHESLQLEVRDSRAEKVAQSTGVGLGIRVLRNGRTGLAYTERLTTEALETAFREAGANADHMDATEVELAGSPLDVPDPENLGLYNPALEHLTPEELLRVGVEMESQALQADPRVKTVTRSITGKSSGSYTVVSTRGLRYTQRSNSVGTYCAVLLDDKAGSVKTGGHSWSRREWNPEEAALVGRQAVLRGAALMGARSIPGGRLPVVLDEHIAPRLLGMYMGNFFAESAQKGRSRLKGRLGEQIASRDISLLDDPHLAGGPGSRYLDDEGIATTPLPLIEQGSFASFLYHIESARKEGRESTGHASRGYSSGISTGFSNLIMPRGEKTLDELCALPERCLLVTELEGASGCNPISGDISIGVQGFLVENGQRKQPVDSVTIAGNFYDLLMNITARGDIYQPNLSSRFIPPLLVDGFTISG